VPEDLKLAAEKRAEESMRMTLAKEQEANYLELIAKRGKGEKAALQALEAEEDAAEKGWSANFKTMLDEVGVQMAIHEEHITDKM